MTAKNVEDKKDPLQQLIDKNPCSACRKRGRSVCTCHSGGGGGESGGGSEGSGKTENNAPHSHGQNPILDSLREQINSLVNLLDNQELPALQLQLNNLSLKHEIIAELLSKNLLSIDDNKELGILTIKCNPRFLSEKQKHELKLFVSLITKELEEFKNKNKLSDNQSSIQIAKDHEGNIISLTISIKDPTLYDAFIQHLENKHLLPSHPRPTPSAKQSRELDPDEEKTSRRRYSPFSIKDGPKPL